MKLLYPVLFFIFSVTTTSLSQNYKIDNYGIKINISKEGHFDINEVITVTFIEESRGIKRNVPKKIKVDGVTQKVALSHVNVRVYDYKLITEGNDNVIRIGNEHEHIIGTHTYNISYRVSGAYIFNKDHTAFQYNLISGWDTSIAKLSYSVILPENIDLAEEDYIIMTGDRGEAERHVSIKRVGNKIIGRSLLPIEANENATIAIKFPVNYISRPPAPIPFYKKDKLWFLPLGFLFLFINYFRRSRQQVTHLSTGEKIQEEHFPPSEFSPAMVGAYYDNKVNTEDVIALLPYWAEQGYIEILKGDEELYFKKIKSLSSDAPKYQTLIFDNLFQSEDMIMLSELKEKMYTHLYKAKGLLHKELLGKNLYDSSYVRIFKSVWMIVLGILLLISAIVVAIVFQYIFTAFGLLVLSISTFVMYAKEPKKSELGIRIHKHLKGLKQFLENSPKATTQELLDNHPKYFEHIYPYAIALGIDKTWLNHMQEYDINAPYWYSNHNSNPNQGSLTIKDFSSDFNIPEITSVFTSAPVSSSSPGSGGGGFSGGGAGGGFGGGGSSW